jgi:2,4-dienoyl-CoA reductase-like NADH-dependent reductase (Old Yellow Enzyme family)
VAPSRIGLPGYAVPREFTIDEIKKLPEQFADAAEKAVIQAGFDGVEIHVSIFFFAEY